MISVKQSPESAPETSQDEREAQTGSRKTASSDERGPTLREWMQEDGRQRRPLLYREAWSRP